MTDAELDHRAEVARIDGNYLAMELIRELRQANTRVESMAAVVAAAEAWRDAVYPHSRSWSADGVRICDSGVISAVDTYRAALDGYRSGGAK